MDKKAMLPIEYPGVLLPAFFALVLLCAFFCCALAEDQPPADSEEAAFAESSGLSADEMGMPMLTEDSFAVDDMPKGYLEAPQQWETEALAALGLTLHRHTRAGDVHAHLLRRDETT